MRKEKATEWVSDASLYCPKNGLPHSIVQELTLRRCPACSQSLYKRERVIPKKKPTGEATGESDENVSYEIEYRDVGGYWIGREDWPGILDLHEARKGEVAEGDEGVMKVVSVVWTNHAPNQVRGASESQFIMEAGILTNHGVDVVPHGTRIEIYSQKFIEMLRKVVLYYPERSIDGKSLTLSEPYALIAYHLPEIEAFKSTFQENGKSTAQAKASSTGLPSRCDQVTYNHIETILTFAKESIWKGKVAEEEARHARKIPLATFSMLWLLYKPGTTVYTESDGRLAAYVVQRMSIDSAVLSLPPEKLSSYRIQLWYLDYDGKYVRRFSREVVIPPFVGEKPITELNVIPCKFQDGQDNGKVRDRLHSEGERWYKLLQGGLVGYQGDTLETPKQNIHDRVVIDCTSYWEHNNLEEKQNKKKKKKKDDSDDEDSDDGDEDEGDTTAEKKPKLVKDYGIGSSKCPCSACLGLRPHPPPRFMWTRYDLIDPSHEATLELSDGPEKDPKHRYLLCSKRVMGFALKSRSWHVFDVAKCGDPRINKKAIDTLVMPEERKRMIKGLVHRYTTQSGPGKSLQQSWQADFIESKGDGRMVRIDVLFLLHGSPGVGKTYTAECIAEFTGRPLLSLTCGDLGNDETETEKQLSKWFKLAERWGAVMLLDEADVYTERRQITDLKRNTMVSVFLRCMEYYRGILFLTTNRVGTFDDAFVSRIHIVIHYKDLDETDRKKIWKRFFQKLKDDRKDDIKIDSDTKDYVLENSKMQKINWNGREIRNAFQTAVALAEYEFSIKEDKEPGERPVLKQEHFEEVCGISLEFKKYLKATHGNMDENQRAANLKIRARTDGLDGIEI
ncbi:P-loop containing nucleoside triphosphate hydrolase protein [Xylariaceae sp. FL0662B]|nr:P-loop containing nucleoside triphosphate hydrolase protein [Xylariaceae sp. FL0662B]